MKTWGRIPWKKTTSYRPVISTGCIYSLPASFPSSAFHLSQKNVDFHVFPPAQPEPGSGITLGASAPACAGWDSLSGQLGYEEQKWRRKTEKELTTKVTTRCSALLRAPEGCWEEGCAALCLGWGFCCCLQVFLPLPDSQLSPAAAFLLGRAPSRSRTRAYKVILPQPEAGQETIIPSQLFLDGAQGICCCNSGLSCQAKSSGEVSTLTGDQPGKAPKKLPHS